MAINIEQIEESLVPVFQSLFPAFIPDVQQDIRCIRGEQAKPRPEERTYVDIRVADFNQEGRERVGPTNPDTNLTRIEADYRLELRVRAIGDQAKQAMSTIQFGLNFPDILDAFEALVPTPLSLSQNTDVVHIPLLTETEWEERAQMTIIFYLEQQEDRDLGTIESVTDVQGTLDGAISLSINLNTGTIDRNA